MNTSPKPIFKALSKSPVINHAKKTVSIIDGNKYSPTNSLDNTSVCSFFQNTSCFIYYTS